MRSTGVAAFAVVLVAAAVSSCGTTSTATTMPSFILSAEAAVNAAATGLNSHGPGAGAADWEALAVAGCEEGAWD